MAAPLPVVEKVSHPDPAPPTELALSEEPRPSHSALRTEGDQHRSASTWVNVRADPSTESPVLGILQPGEVVEVDSLAQGWYRVQSDRLPAGYVDRRLLDPGAEAPARPTADR